MPDPPTREDLRRLIRLVARLRAPDGCPWDREQSLTDLRAYLLEEAHEAAAAIDRGDWPDLAEELGDLLFQIAFILRLGEEAGELSLEEVVAASEAKMIERHPHVFGDTQLPDEAAVRRAWARRKARRENDQSLLGGVSESLPALTAAYRMSQKAADAGFDWEDPGQVLTKLEEESAELQRELAGGGDAEKIREELGDLLFTLVNLARHLGTDPEAALAGANRKFRRRFRRVERELESRGRSVAESGMEELEELWRDSKGRDRSE